MVNVDLDNEFSDLRIDWKDQSGGVNSVYLLDFIGEPECSRRDRKHQIEANGKLEEKLSHHVSWLPNIGFKMTGFAATVCTASAAITIVVFEVVKAKWTIFPDSLSYYSALVVACLLVLGTTFGFFVN